MNKLMKAIRLQELDGVTDSLWGIFSEDAAVKKNAFVAEKMTALHEQSESFTTAILQDKVLSNLDTLDAARDSAFSALEKGIAGYAQLPVPALQAAAAPLKAICEKYKKAGITKAAYIAESSQLESLFKDLAAPALAENIASLSGIAESITALRTAQDEFAKAFNDYIKNKSEKAYSATSFRKPILSLINDDLVPYLNAMVIAKDADCASFAAKLETLINRTNEQIKKRGKPGE